MKFLPLLGVSMAFVLISAASPRADPSYGPELQGFAYPWPVAHYRFTSQGDALDMAYMDVKPAQPERTHGSAAARQEFLCRHLAEHHRRLTEAGYRVIAPDQIGFCKSSKPAHYQYSFQQLAGNTHALLDSLGDRPGDDDRPFDRRDAGDPLWADVSAEVEQLVLVDPIGLEDWKAQGRALAERGCLVSAANCRRRPTASVNYEHTTYYAGTWEPAYERWVQMLAGMYRGPGRADRRLELRAALRHDLYAAGGL